jgi:hypothetical protein
MVKPLASVRAEPIKVPLYVQIDQPLSIRRQRPRRISRTLDAFLGASDEIRILLICGLPNFDEVVEIVVDAFDRILMNEPPRAGQSLAGRQGDEMCNDPFWLVTSCASSRTGAAFNP